LTRVKLAGGSYTSQSVNADAQRTVNLYPEQIESGDGTTDIALYPTPGLKKFAVFVAPGACLSIAKTPNGTFTQGQNGATYSVVVTNDTSSASLGLVTVTENVPTGLTFVSMAGAGWTVVGNVATRSDALAPGASYPTLTVTVNVASNAPSMVNNNVSIAGGGCTQINNAQNATAIVASGGGGSIISVASPIIGSPFTSSTVMLLEAGASFPLPLAGPVVVLLPLFYSQITDPSTQPVPVVNSISDTTGATWTAIKSPVSFLPEHTTGFGVCTYQLYSASFPAGIPVNWQVTINLAGPSSIGFVPHTLLMVFTACTGVDASAFNLIAQPGAVTGAPITTSAPRVIVTIASGPVSAPSGVPLYCQSGSDQGLGAAIYSSTGFFPNSSTLEHVDLQPAGTYNPTWGGTATNGSIALSTVAVVPA